MALPSHRRHYLALALAAVSLGACRSERIETTGALYPSDTRIRHPYILADQARTLDVFVTGTGHLDPRQAADVSAFLLEFRRYGRGTLVMDLPRGVAPGLVTAADRTGAAIRRLGAESGVSGAVVVSHYTAASPALSAPVRLSFQRMQAKVADQCGLWPQDLGVGSPAFSTSNQPSWNLGCAVRSSVAAQVADPVDLVRGREEGRIDTVRRSNDIGRLREGKDPSIQWRQDGLTSVKDKIGAN